MLTYADIIPNELIKEHLLSLPIKDIMNCRLVSKEFKSVIDNLWYDLIKRDFHVYIKNNCEKEYRERYSKRNDLYITKQEIIDIANEVYNKVKYFSIDDIISDIEGTLLSLGYRYDKYIDIYSYYPKCLLEEVFFAMKNTRHINIGDYDTYIFNKFERFAGRYNNIKICSKEYNRYLNNLKHFFPKLMNKTCFTFDYDCITITYYNYYELYDKTYGNETFDSDFASIKKRLLK